MISLAGSSKGKASLRDRAILEVLYSTGMRVSELVNLKLNDLDLASGLVRCMGKGGKMRVLMLGKYASKSLEDYFRLQELIEKARREGR